MSKKSTPTSPLNANMSPKAHMALAFTLSLFMTVLLAYLYLASDSPMFSGPDMRNSLWKLMLFMGFLSVVSGGFLYLMHKKIIKPVKAETPEATEKEQ